MSHHESPPPERDLALDAAWRAHSTERPPPGVDAAILAAAHRAVASRPRDAVDADVLAEAREPSRWWWGLAAAATIGAIAFGVVQLAQIAPAPDPMHASDIPSNAGGAPPPMPAPKSKSEGSAASEAKAAPSPASPRDLPAMHRAAPELATPARPSATSPRTPRSEPFIAPPSAPASAESLWLGYRVETALGDRAAADEYARRLRTEFAVSPQAGLLDEAERPGP